VNVKPGRSPSKFHDEPDILPGTTDAAVWANTIGFPIDTQGTPDYVFGNK